MESNEIGENPATDILRILASGWQGREEFIKNYASRHN